MSIQTINIPANSRVQLSTTSFSPAGDAFVIANNSSIPCVIGFGVDEKSVVASLDINPHTQRRLSVKDLGPFNEMWLWTLPNSSTALVVFDESTG